MIAIIDYDAGNLRSVEKALLSLGETPVITRDRKTILKADKVILPGVGSFGDAMGKLKQYDLVDVICETVDQGTPFLGICLGMQMAVVEFARHVCGMKGAHSSELDPDTPYPVIDLMEGQRGVTDKGGTMRLGAFPCRIDREDTAAFQAYRTSDISERHRHRYEFNNEYRQRLTQAGLRLSGLSPDGRLVEIVELPSHPWFVGVQFHPELKSRPNRAHPLFREFIFAAKEKNRE